MSNTEQRRDRNFHRSAPTNEIAEQLLIGLPRDTSLRTLPHVLPGCSLDANGRAIPEEERQPQVWEDGVYIAVCNRVARELQKYNTCNRNRRENNVTRLVDAMMTNAWMYNGKSSTLACSNTAILDSQHFLEAAVRYFEGPETEHVKRPFLMRVEMGLPPETFATYDNGAKRTVADTLVVGAATGSVDYGDVSDTLLASSQRLLLQYLNNVHDDLKPTDLEYLPNERAGLVNSRACDILRAYPNLVSSAAFITTLRGLQAFVKGHVAVVAHMLISEIQSTNAANNFLRGLATGVNLEEGSPVLALRSVYMKSRSRKRRMEGPEALAFFIRAWNFFAEGKTISAGRLRGFDPENKIPVPQRLSRARRTEAVES
jgi:hypothetical protein